MKTCVAKRCSILTISFVVACVTDVGEAGSLPEADEVTISVESDSSLTRPSVDRIQLIERCACFGLITFERRDYDSTANDGGTFPYDREVDW